ncbi:MAG TPA: hypothetical protein VIY48_21995 [Candidatus Paceibacterota bacterium]
MAEDIGPDGTWADWAHSSADHARDLAEKNRADLCALEEHMKALTKRVDALEAYLNERG